MSARQTIQWGILSTAAINAWMLPCMLRSSRSNIFAVASRSEPAAAAYAQQWRIPRGYGSYDALLADPNIDAVYVSLPNSLHAEWVVRALDAGKHVLCEKPIALSLEEIDRITAAAERNERIAQEGTMMRFHPQTSLVKRLVAERTIGDVRLVRGVFTYVLLKPDDSRLKPGGGSLWDLGCYCVSFARAVLDAEPMEVYASQITNEVGIDLSLSAELRFAGGTTVQFFSSLETFVHVEADLLGSKGRIHLDLPWLNRPGHTARVQWIHDDGPGIVSTLNVDRSDLPHESQTFENVNAFEDELHAMEASILDGAPVVIALADSRRNIHVMRSLLESARSGRRIRVT